MRAVQILQYCELLRAYINYDDMNEFVLKQMLTAALHLDLADEVGRRSLDALQRMCTHLYTAQRTRNAQMNTAM